MTRKRKHDDLPTRDHPDYMKMYRERKLSKDKQREYYENYMEKNPDCRKDKYDPVKAKEYRDTNKKYLSEKNWESRGIVDLTYDKFTETMDLQNMRCACCGNELKKRPQADHCHTTGLFRSVICPSCNMGLGVYEKNKEMFEKYLGSYGKV